MGVAHPGPAKARQFVEIDLKSGLEAVRIASVQQEYRTSFMAALPYPAPAMKAYIHVRSQCVVYCRQRPQFNNHPPLV